MSPKAAPAKNEEDDDDFADLSALLGPAKEAFIEWARPALADAKAASPRLAKKDFAAARDEIFAVFHDLKGGGGGVGLSLISEIGDSGCCMLRDLDAPNARAVKVIQAHIAAAEGVFAAGIEGDGGEAGEMLAQKLRTIASA